MRALVVCALRSPGTATLVREVSSESDFVVAVDGGGRSLAEAGVSPDLFTGDADSVDSETLERLAVSGVEIQLFPRDKDRTDLDLALAAVREQGATEVTVTGAVGGRLDHTLATLGSLRQCLDMRPVIREPDLTGWLLDPAYRSEITFTPRAVVSVMSLSDTARVHSAGLRWPLDGLELNLMDSCGVSNRPVDEAVTLRVSQGVVLVVSAKDDSAIHTAE